MMKTSNYTRGELEAYVQACGVKPAANYLLLKRELSGAKVIASLLVGRPPKTQAQRSAREDDYLLICGPVEFYLIDLSHSPAPNDVAFSAQRRIPLTAVQSFVLRPAAGVYELHLTMGTTPETYYCSTVRSDEEAYLVDNLRALLKNGFYGLTPPRTPHFAPATAPTAHPDPVPQNVAAPGRPERQRDSILKSLLGKPKRS
jgi:hypothetical protein